MRCASCRLQRGIGLLEAVDSKVALAFFGNAALVAGENERLVVYKKGCMNDVKPVHCECGSNVALASWTSLLKSHLQGVLCSLIIIVSSGACAVSRAGECDWRCGLQMAESVQRCDQSQLL